MSGPHVSHHHGTAAELHAMAMPLSGGDQLWAMHPTRTALVLGSAQRSEEFDLDRLEADGVALAPRRSGGGAVLIEPAQTVWIDVLAARSGDLWSSELGATFVAVGRRWQAAFESLGVEVDLCDRPSARTVASSVVCWAGLGWGELTLDGAKLVGLSQRRTRWGARIQALSLLGDSTTIERYLTPDRRDQVAGAIRPGPAAALERAGVTTDRLRAAVLAQFA